MDLYTNEIISLIEKEDPNHVMIVDRKGRSIKVNELLYESKCLALALAKLGIDKNSKVVMACNPGVIFTKILFANMMLRTQVSIIDPEMGRENYKHKLEQLKPEFAFIDRRLLLLQDYVWLKKIYFKLNKRGFYFPKTANIQYLTIGTTLPLRHQHARIENLIKPRKKIKLSPPENDHEFLITYTSGTTDSPKGVVHSFANLRYSIDHLVHLTRSTKTQFIATHLPQFMLLGALTGVTVKLWNPSWTVRKRIAFLEREQINILFAPPVEYLPLILYCEENETKLPSSLTKIFLASAPAHIPFIKRLVHVIHESTRVICFYGMTENLVVAHCLGREKIGYDCKGDLLGQVADQVEIKITEEDEILIKSPQLFKRYLGEGLQSGWHSTGDLGYLDKNRMLVLTGRKKDMIIRRNFNIYPALYESTIEQIDGIITAVMVGIYEEQLADEKVYLCIESDGKLTERKVRKELIDGAFSIDKQALPDQILFLALPRKGRQSKVDKVGLRKRIVAQLH